MQKCKFVGFNCAGFSCSLYNLFVIFNDSKICFNLVWNFSVSIDFKMIQKRHGNYSQIYTRKYMVTYSLRHDTEFYAWVTMPSIFLLAPLLITVHLSEQLLQYIHGHIRINTWHWIIHMGNICLSYFFLLPNYMSVNSYCSIYVKLILFKTLCKQYTYQTSF